MIKILNCCTILLLMLSCAKAPKSPQTSEQREALKMQPKEKIDELQQLLCPVENGRVGSRQRPPVMGIRGFRDRLLIHGENKASVFSVIDGIVSAVYLKSDRVIISSEELEFEYRFFDIDFTLKKGAIIKKGDRIGQVYGLEKISFMVRKGEKPINHHQYSFECEKEEEG